MKKKFLQTVVLAFVVALILAPAYASFFCKESGENIVKAEAFESEKLGELTKKADCAQVTSVKTAEETPDKSRLDSAIDGLVRYEQKNYGGVGQSVFNKKNAEKVGKGGLDWLAIALARDGQKENYFQYLSVLCDYVDSAYQTANRLDKDRATEWHRISLAVLALGGDPTAFGKNGDINLILDGTYLHDNLDRQGINGLIWAVICLNSAGQTAYATKDGEIKSSRLFVDKIISQQKSDGGFCMSGSVGNIDITAMAIQALAPDYLRAKAQSEPTAEDNILINSVDIAVDFLIKEQTPDGYFEDAGVKNVESCASVIQAMVALKISIFDERFVKDGQNIFDKLKSFECQDGGYAHQLGDKKSDKTASVQTLISLVSLRRERDGKTNFYDMSDVEQTPFYLTANSKTFKRNVTIVVSVVGGSIIVAGAIISVVVLRKQEKKK